MKIVTLDEYKDEFLDHCKKFYKLNDRNKEWFNPSNPSSIPNSYAKYPLWTFLLNDNNDLISLSCVQTHHFPKNCARFLTRTFYNPKFRRKHLKYEKEEKTPAMYMLEAQLEKIKCEHRFISVEFIRRRNSLVELAKKLNDKYNSSWVVLNDLYHTYPDSDDPHSWQPVCVLQTKSKFPLRHIPQSEWESIYGRKVFNTKKS